MKKSVQKKNTKTEEAKEKISKSRVTILGEGMYEGLGDNQVASSEIALNKIKIKKSDLKKIQAQTKDEIGGKASIAKKARMVATKAIEQFSQKGDREGLVNNSKNVFEGTITLLSTLGFQIVDNDNALNDLKFDEDIPADHYYISLTHKKLKSIGFASDTKGAEVAVWLTFRSEPKSSVTLRYVLHYPENKLYVNTIPQKEVNIFSVSDESVRVGAVVKKGVIDFLSRLGAFSLSVDQLQSKKLTKDQVQEVRQQIAEEYMCTPRINRHKFIWPKDFDSNPFNENLIFDKERTLFETMVNGVAFFLAGTRIDKENGNSYAQKSYIYLAILEKTYVDNNYKVNSKDIVKKAIKLPHAYSRRTAINNSNTTAIIEEVLNNVDADLVYSEFSI